MKTSEPTISTTPQYSRECSSTTTTMVIISKSGKGKDVLSRAKKRKVKTKTRADEKALEIELERKYILQRFYDIGDVFANLCLVLLGIETILLCYLPGAQYTCICGMAYWLLWIILSKHIVRYKGTEHELYGKNLFENLVLVLFPLKEVFQGKNNGALASEEGRNAHAAMVILTVYFLGTMNFRMANPRDSSPAAAIIMGLIGYNYPRFGIFSPRYEALAFFVAVGLGLLIGSAIDEMRWRHFLSMHKIKQEHNRELSKAKQRSEALEDLACCQESDFFEIIRP